MKSKTGWQDSRIIKDQSFSRYIENDGAASGMIDFNGVPGLLASEGNESFRHYIEWLGLASDPKLVVLSSVHHYYYDAEEMRHIKTVVNLKELNHIKDISGYLKSMYLILPPKCYLLGCFVDNKRQSIFSFIENKTSPDSDRKSEEVKNGIVSRVPILNTIFTFLDAKTNKYLSTGQVSILFENNGFRIIDMTELNGLTYFCLQTLRSIDN